MDSVGEGNGSIRLSLSRAEALVLFDLLHRAEALDSEYSSLGARPAEHRVLWDISALLERHLTEPFAADYDRLVAMARAEVAEDGS